MKKEQIEFLPVVKAFKEVTGNRPSPATVWRYANQGLRGRILKTWIVLGRRVTTCDAVREFIDPQSNSNVPAPLSDVLKKLDAELGRVPK